MSAPRRVPRHRARASGRLTYAEIDRCLAEAGTIIAETREANRGAFVLAAATRRMTVG